MKLAIIQVPGEYMKYIHEKKSSIVCTQHIQSVRDMHTMQNP